MKNIIGYGLLLIGYTALAMWVVVAMATVR